MVIIRRTEESKPPGHTRDRLTVGRSPALAFSNTNAHKAWPKILSAKHADLISDARFVRQIPVGIKNEFQVTYPTPPLSQASGCNRARTLNLAGFGSPDPASSDSASAPQYMTANPDPRWRRVIELRRHDRNCALGESERIVAP